jgi:hypothetical protein
MARRTVVHVLTLTLSDASQRVPVVLLDPTRRVLAQMRNMLGEEA